MDPPKEKEVYQKLLGDCGKYQLFVVIMVGFSKVPVAWHQMNFIFMAGPSPFVCPDTGNATCPCASPVYNLGPFKTTVASEWNLICDKTWMESFMQSMLQLGVLVGSMTLGSLSDCYGRRTGICISVVISIVSGVVTTYMPGYWSFTIARAFQGLAVGGFIVTGFVFMMENIAPRHRPAVTGAAHIPFNAAHMWLATVGYFVRDFRSLVLFTTLPVALLLSYFFFIPESILWLLATKKTDRAIAGFERAARINKRSTSTIRAEIEAYQVAHKITTKKKGSFVDLFRTRNIRRNSICMAITYLSCSYCFYGMSQYVVYLNGDVYLNVAISALISMMGSFISIPLMLLCKRRWLVIALNTIATVCLFSMTVLRSDETASVVLASIGIAGNFAIFCVVFLWCMELFPIVIRGNALGFCSTMARVGSMIAPFTISLKWIGDWAPPLAFGVMPIISTIMCVMLPETKGCATLSTIEEGEAFGSPSASSEEEASE